MNLNQRNNLKTLLKHLKKLLISILLVIAIWGAYIGIAFQVNPRLFVKTRVDEDITWEIEKYEPTETYPGETYIIFNIKFEVWINTPLPFIHSLDGCHLKPLAEAILTNTSISNKILYYYSGCYLATVPAFYTPGITHKTSSVYFWVNYTEMPSLPEGFYTFWVDFGDLGGKNGIIESYKTYMNVSEEGISVYSDDTVDYTVWYGVRFITSSSIITGSIVVIYIGLVFKNKIIERLRKKRD
ncbi:MAG: hypothetical protein ACW99E_02250 [Promethearchaeota archaeon]|jgi:hypothetical protein